MNKKNIIHEKGKDFFAITSKKTRVKTFIPIHPVVQRICQKYDWSLPHVSNQHFNDEIKKAAKIAGINSLVSKREYFKGKPIQKTYPKYELITSHTCRRTCATNMYLSGVSIDLIMAVTGHKTSHQVMDYIKADALERSLIVSKSDFFSGNSFLKSV